MWYTSITNSLDETNLDYLLTNITSLTIDDFWNIISNTMSVIGHATSIDGKNWNLYFHFLSILLACYPYWRKISSARDANDSRDNRLHVLGISLHKEIFPIIKK